jgi:hypothetical protein
MQTDDPAKRTDNTHDTAQRDHHALRKALDAAWSRLIHTRESARPGEATPAEEMTTERREEPETQHEPDSRHLW